MMEIVSSITNFVRWSAKKLELIKRAILEKYSDAKRVKLQSLSDTRWLERHDALLQFKKLLDSIVQFLEEMDGTSPSSKSTNLLASIQRFDFVLPLTVAAAVFEITVSLSRQLQGLDLDVNLCYEMVDSAIRTLERYRETKYGEIFQEACRIVEPLDIPVQAPRTAKRSTHRLNIEAPDTPVKGKRQVGMIASAERGQLTTVIGCCNAAGSFLPPFLIFARKKMQPRLLDGSPAGTQGTCTPNDCTSSEVFLNWLHFFVEQYDIARLLALAFHKTAVAINAVHGFERPGIWPVNKHAFGDEHFTPAQLQLNLMINSLTNATLQSDSIINPTQENSPILESINPLTVSSPDVVESREFLGRSQSEDDVAIEDCPSTSTESETTKETQSNDVPAVSPDVQRPTIVLQF
ncbi:hypothetical protein ILUMI_19923 [Ignelater luminosus]|uniref:Uncharacterized protein n=1 Tax=Ignelater luminosus TaxID=2038154 RepID=A0A8K0CF87_IGNLU|nr:hypothetical protein ILUMI_19923 [Ignelater luminosus]